MTNQKRLWPYAFVCDQVWLILTNKQRRFPYPYTPEWFDINGEPMKPVFDQVDPAYTHFEIPNDKLCVPFNSEEDWLNIKEVLMKTGRTMRTGCSYIGPANGMMGAGPYYDREQQIFFAQRSFRRMNELGIKIIGVWGGYFGCPEGYGRTKAIDDAISYCNILADEAEKYGIQIALEPNANLITLFPRYLESVEFAKLTGRKCIKVMPDTHYFIILNQDINDILKAPEYCINCHINGQVGNTMSQPNVTEYHDMNKRMIEIFKEINYKGVITVAAPWVSTKGGELDLRYETRKTVEYLDSLMEKL
jgi:sugar phosphate isomerase/epimerase